MIPKRNLTIAVSQYPVSANIEKNLSYCLDHINIAKEKGAEVVQFSECSLTGYGGIDFLSYDDQNYELVLSSLKEIMKIAGDLKIRVLIGSHFFVKDFEKPKNVIFYINENGEFGARYEKRILAGTEGTLDHVFYAAGDDPVVFEINGIKCGMLICHEWRYPELYREYKKLGVQLIFHSWYDAGYDPKAYIHEGTQMGELIVGATRGNAANNYLWVSGSNNCNRESSFPSFVAQPDGRILNRLKRNVPGLLIATIDFDQKFDDPSFYGRRRFL